MRFIGLTGNVVRWGNLVIQIRNQYGLLVPESETPKTK